MASLPTFLLVRRGLDSREHTPISDRRIHSPQDVIKKSFLPMRSWNIRAAQCFRQRILQRFHPNAELRIGFESDKEMDVIRHDDIRAKISTMALALLSKS